MSITGEQRHRLIRALERELGEEEAATLMEYLPPTGWADVATKRDLDHQDALLRAEIARLELRMDSMEHRVEARISEAMRTQTLTLLPGMAVLLAIFGAVASLL